MFWCSTLHDSSMLQRIDMWVGRAARTFEGERAAVELLYAFRANAITKGDFSFRAREIFRLLIILKQIQAMARFHPTLLLGAALANEISGEVR